MNQDVRTFIQSLDASSPNHPQNALIGAQAQSRILPVCDHYCGVEKRMRKSLELQRELGQKYGRSVFDVTLDCEDGAPIGQEREHAQLVIDVLHENAAQLAKEPAEHDGIKHRVAVRVHAIDHPHFERDVQMIVSQAGHLVDYIMLPKVEAKVDVEHAVQSIDSATSGNANLGPAVPVHALIESPFSVNNAFDIAAHPRIESLSFGLMDFVSAHNGAIPQSAMAAQGQFEHPLVVQAKLAISSACHAYGKTPSHCVVTEFKDLEKLRNAVHTAHNQLGYTRMWSIHPSQIEAIVQGFSPSQQELEKAVEVLSRAMQAQWAPIAYEEELHDRASYRYFWYVLSRVL